MRRILAIILSILIGYSTQAAASLADLETAIIQQDYTKAKKIAPKLAKSLKSSQEIQQVNFYLGLSHLRLGEYVEARAVFDGLIREELDAQLRDRTYLGLFNAYYLSEDYSNALKTINYLYEISPDSVFLSTIYLKQARVNLKLTQWRKARENLKAILEKFPESLEAPTAKQLLEEKQYFAVQVGAFLERELAEQQVQELRQKDEYGYIVETTDKDDRIFYRVRVGQMTLLDDARQLKLKLSQEGYPAQIYP